MIMVKNITSMFEDVLYSNDRKISNASIVTTSTYSSTSSDVKMNELTKCVHRRSIGSIETPCKTVGLLDKADQDNRIKNQILRKHKSSCQLISDSTQQVESNIKIVMNLEEDVKHSSLNTSQLEIKLKANAGTLKTECMSRQHRSNSCTSGMFCCSPKTVNNHLSVPDQSINLAFIKNRKTSASSILDKPNRYEINTDKFCSNCCLDTQSSNSDIYFDFASSDSFKNSRTPSLNDANFKSHILRNDTLSGFNLTKSTADILLENIDFKNGFSNQKLRKMVKFKSDTNFITNFDYEITLKEDSKTTITKLGNNNSFSKDVKYLKKSSNNQKQRLQSTTSIMFSQISKPLIKMNSKLKFRSKSSTHLNKHVSSNGQLECLADTLQNPKSRSQSIIPDDRIEETKKSQRFSTTSLMHGYYAQNYQLYHQHTLNNNAITSNKSKYNKNKEKRSMFCLNDSCSNVNQNSNVKALACNFAKDIKSKATNLLRRRHTEASFTDKGIIPSRDEIYKWQISFENLLKHKYGIALFRGFLKTEFSEENIEFWLECEDYKYTSKEIKRIAKSKKIYQDFVAIGAPKEVNLDIELRAITAQNILNPSQDTFDRAQKRIQALMEKDSYPRFLESNLYKNLLGTYTPPQGLNVKSNPVCASNESISSSSMTKSSIQASLSKIFSNKSSQNESQNEKTSQSAASTSSSNDVTK